MEGGLFSLETKRGIETAQLSLSVAGLRSSVVKVEEDRFTDDRTVSFPSSKISPSSCRGLEIVNGHILSMRFRLLVETTPKPSVEKKTKEADEIESLAASPLSVRLTGSGVKVLQQNTIFSRILPLPSDNWQEIAAVAWCHRHHKQPSEMSDVTHTDRFTEQKDITPLPSDCLYDELRIIVHHSVLQKDAIGLKRDESYPPNEFIIYSKPCRTVIGVAREADYGYHDVWCVTIGSRQISVSHVTLWRHCADMCSKSKRITFEHLTNKYGGSSSQCNLLPSRFVFWLCWN
jgi:hypothetical protein